MRLIDRATGKTIARGTVERRTLRLGVLAGTKLKKGTYLLKRTAKNASGRKQADGDAPVMHALSDRCLDLGDTCR